tara:strand:- start:8 stop:277 length:270 start_codon:yes stop_codon:yes gene_type:complete
MSEDRRERFEARRKEQQEHYKELLREILDTLEGGDVSLDFEDAPSAATTIRIIANIAGTALRGLESIEELKRILDKEFGDEDNHKEMSK